MSEPCAKRVSPASSQEIVNIDMEATNDSTTVADEVDGVAASAQVDDVNDSSSADGTALGAPSTPTALSPRLQQRPFSEDAEGIAGLMSLDCKRLCADSDFDAPARNSQSPTSSLGIVYTDVLNPDVSDASPALDLAEELFKKGHYSLAYAEAEQAMGSGDNERFLSVLGDAAYGMRKWELAASHYQKLYDAFPSNKDGKKRLRRAQNRLAESLTGIYDIAKLYDLREKSEMDIDVADFLGPIELADIPGKGFVATQDVQKGTLLMVSKAFAIADVNSTEAIAQIVAGKLQLRPEMAAEISALYDGNKRVACAPVDQGIPGTERLTRICEYGWGKCGKYRGLWILPSYFNYSCLTTAYCNVYGDVATFFAVTDLKRGDEITITCISDPLRPYKLREHVYRDIYGFTCTCRLCELDRSDARYEERQKLVELALEEHAFMFRTLSPSPATGVLARTLEQLRASYANRNELRAQMYEPLLSLTEDYMMTDSKNGYEMALKQLVEITECLNERLLIEVAVLVYTKMANCYDNLNDETNARKYVQMAADVDRICTGGDVALFKKKYGEAHKFNHLL